MWSSRKRWAVFISGTGSNLGAILDTRYLVDVALVVSSAANVFGLLKAKRAGVECFVLPKTIDWDELDLKLKTHNIDTIFLAGFMKLIPESFVQKWTHKIFNVHPSLLPSYPGLNSIEKAFHDKKSVGVTVHEVTAQMDAGPHLLQRRVDFDKDLKFENVEFLVHLSEHRLVRESMNLCKNVLM